MTTRDLNNWRHSLLERLPPRLTGLFQGDERHSLLKQVNTVLMLYDARLYDLSNGSWRQLPQEALQGDPAALVATAETLLNHEVGERAVLLLLPSGDFIATSVNMPGVARENLRAALRLQAGVLLPTYERSLAFAVKPAHGGSEQSDVVLWTDEQRLDALFKAFGERGLFLTAVMPRALAALGQMEADWSDNAAGWQLEDQDATTLTWLRCRSGALTDWLQVENADLEDEDFRQQWQQATHSVQAANAGESARPRLRMHSAQAYIDLAGAVKADPDYALLPSGAQAALRKTEKGQRLRMAAVAAAVVVLLAAMPLLWQSVQSRALQAALESAREEAAEASADQAVVREFEQSWGVLSEYPRQDVAATLLALQSVINPGVLTSLEMEEGSVQIEGDSSDPQSLLQQLEQNPQFTGVDFARATNNNHYYIDLRLTTVDFDGYLQRHFPDARRR